MTKGLKALVAWPLAVLLVVGLPEAGLAEDRRTAPCRLNVMTFNEEFLWDGVEPEEGSADFPWKGSQTEAEDHMRQVAEVIKRVNPIYQGEEQCERGQERWRALVRARHTRSRMPT